MKSPHGRLRGIRILHEDADVIVVEKAAGILSQATRRGDAYSVEDALGDYVRKGQWKSSRHVYLVHRLDRETSGVMMVAKTESAQTWLRDHWGEVTSKVYLARVEGALEKSSGAFESYLREDEHYFVRSVKNPKFGKFARTEWEVVPEKGPPPRGPRTTLVAATLKTGRKNQIRVQFAEAGHPVAGDAKYGRGRRGDGLCLHAWKLSFVHPATGETLAFETGLPSFAANASFASSSENDNCGIMQP